MHRHTRFSSVLTALAMLLGSLALVVATAPAASADTYTPAPGARINNPHGGWDAKKRIHRHIIRSIYSVPAGKRIRIMSWNIRSKSISEALVRAHRKGVTVQVIMQDDNAYEHEVDPNNPIPAPGDPNPLWWWMKREFAKYGNSTRPNGYKSFADLCDASCRGGSGIAHTKLLIFEQVYRTPYVVMYGSGNLTDAAGTIQWNDLQTVVNNKVLYDFSNYRFGEMARDRRMANPYRMARNRGVQMAVFPWYGEGTWGDPVMRALAPVRCSGAASGYGTSSGRTIIRVSQTSIGDSRGKKIAWRLRDLKNRGCSVKVLYGLMGPEVKSILRGGGVPIHQLATDDDGDLIYDRYLHQKALTINGNYASDRSTTLVYNGSANMQNYTLSSDEIFGRVSAEGTVRFYQRFVDDWFGRTARTAGFTRSADGLSTTSDDVDEDEARKRGIDPYAKFQVN